MKTTTHWMIGCALLVSVVGCGEDQVCAGLPAARIVPSEATITVGETLMLRLEDGGYCTGHSPAEATYQPVATHWTTADTAVVSLDSLTGTVTGRRPGDAHVIPTVQLGGLVAIHVR
jgi:hypothetical protein